MPLAINSIASLLAGGKDSTWEYVHNSLGALSKGNGIENMKEILDLSYIHLPDHLKTCLLYVCMYPEDREINKNELLRKWVAEGFVPVRRNGVFDAEDVAEQYLEELINMCMIQPEKIDYNNEVLSCRVHDIILDLMRSKSGEVNFIQVIDGLKDVSGPRGEIRRVSVQYNNKEDGRVLDTIKVLLSHAPSVLLYQASFISVFLEYKYVRILHIEDGAYLRNLDLTGISSLLLLRYLKIACYSFSEGKLKLPDQIGQLQQLETIDLEGCKLRNYPSDIVTLPRLSHLRYYSGHYGIMLPDGIGRLRSLHTLEGVCVHKSSIETIKGLSELTNLRNLVINSFYTSDESEEVVSARMDTLHSSILRLSTSLMILTLKVGLPNGHDLSCRSRTLFPQGSHIRKLELSHHCFRRFPECIGQLHDLYSLSIGVTEVGDGMSIVGGLPSLAYFCLVVVNCEEEHVVVPGSLAFQALNHLVLKFDCDYVLTFEEQAMPKLEKLYITLCRNIIRKLACIWVGIEHLPAPRLTEISLTVASVWIEWNVKGSEQWSGDDWDMYWDSDHGKDKTKGYTRKKATLLRRAFKSHHPKADIKIHFEDDVKFSDSEDVDDENYEEDGDEEYDEEAYDDEDFCMEDCLREEYVDFVDDEEEYYNNDGTLVNTVAHLNQAASGGRVGIAASAAIVQPQAKAVYGYHGEDIFLDNLMPDSYKVAEDNEDVFLDSLLTDEEFSWIDEDLIELMKRQAPDS